MKNCQFWKISAECFDVPGEMGGGGGDTINNIENISPDFRSLLCQWDVWGLISATSTWYEFNFTNIEKLKISSMIRSPQPNINDKTENCCNICLRTMVLVHNSPLTLNSVLTTKVDTDFPPVPVLCISWLQISELFVKPSSTTTSHHTTPASTNIKFNNWNFCCINLIKPDI